MRITKIIAAFALSAALASCGHDGSFSADFAQQTQDFDELREQLNVRIQSTGAAGTLPSGCTAETGCSPESFHNFIRDVHCSTQSGWTSHCTYPPSSMTNNCGAEACIAELNLCVAQTLLEITQLAAPQMYPPSGATTLTIPPQSAATNSELARLSYRASRVAFDRAAVSLGASAAGRQTGLAAASKCTGESVPATDINLAGASIPMTNTQVSWAELFVGVLGESVLVAREAAVSTTRFSQAVSDARLSSESEEERARAYALNLPFGSRGSAAHTLVGGEMGLPIFEGSAIPSTALDNFTNPLFGAERLSAEGTQALEYLRMAAPAPSTITSASSIDTLFTTPSDNITTRLSGLLGDPDLASQPPAGVYQRLGLSQRAFVEARNYLAAELRAFGRDNTMTTLPAEPLPRIAGTSSATTTAWPIYAATRVRPARPLRTWWNAVLRYESAPPTTTGQLAFQNITTLTTTIPAFSVPAAGYGDIVDPSTTDSSVVPTSVAAFLDGAATALRRASISPMWSGTTLLNAANQVRVSPHRDHRSHAIVITDLTSS